MMDYEHQPANHLSFRVARRVIVPKVFPNSRLRDDAARGKESDPLCRLQGRALPSRLSTRTRIVEQLRLDREGDRGGRQPPRGALYHRTENWHFEHLIDIVRTELEVQMVLLPREDRGRSVCGTAQAESSSRHGRSMALSLLARADLVIGGGGTMTRESAFLGTPTYTVFMGRPAAGDAELMRLGLLRDLRSGGLPDIRKAVTAAPVDDEDRTREDPASDRSGADGDRLRRAMFECSSRLLLFDYFGFRHVRPSDRSALGSATDALLEACHWVRSDRVGALSSVAVADSSRAEIRPGLEPIAYRLRSIDL